MPSELRGVGHAAAGTQIAGPTMCHLYMTSWPNNDTNQPACRGMDVPEVAALILCRQGATQADEAVSDR
jgi:hypothetical protein